MPFATWSTAGFNSCRARLRPNGQVGILTVSDTASKDASTDITGPRLQDLIASDDFCSEFQVSASSIVSDDEAAILSALGKWSTRLEDGSPMIQLCITTGGTGFSSRDNTPEAVRKLVVRDASGLQHLMLSTSLQKTPMAALARPVAGVTDSGMLIMTVPGSPKGAIENAEAVLRVAPHALDLLSGGSGRAVHQSMGNAQRQNSESVSSKQEDPSHLHTNDSHHHHHRHSHSHAHGYHHHGHAQPQARTVRSMDTSKGVSGRHRVSQYPIIPLTEAYRHILDNAPVMPVENARVTPGLVGQVIAEDVSSSLDLPSTRTTNVDGYAVAAAVTPPGTYPVLSASNYPGNLLSDPLPSGHIYRINTGGPLPAGTDAVVMVEDTELAQSDQSTKEEKTVKILCQVEINENVRLPGSDVQKGDLVLEKGTRISEIGGEIGTLAFVGRQKVSVHKRPTVAILSTGNELSELHGQSSEASQGPVIYDSNRPSLEACLRARGFPVVDMGIAPDDEKSTTDALKRGCQEADVIITTGGTSMGEGDLLKPVIERNLDGTVHFGRVAMKPGKPTTFASIPSTTASTSTEGKAKSTLVFALPGNPASALVTFHLFVLPALRKMSGFPEHQYHLPKVHVKTLSNLTLDPRPEFHRVWVESTSEPPYLVARSTGEQRSSRTVSLANANAMICLPSSNDSSEKQIQAGSVVEAIMMSSL